MEFTFSSSSFAKPKTQWKHDVFINFRGEDTRRKFVAYLHYYLSNVAGVNTFVDENLGKGMRLEELFGEIEGSQIAIVVFSKSYTESSWCLDELAKIIECSQTYGQAVIPVFYEIDPSDVSHQKGAFANALKATAKRRYSGERLKYEFTRWSNALTQAKKFIGWNARNYKREVELVMKVVNDVLKRLKYEVLSITEFPVGLESQVQNVISLIENRSTEVYTIGIWGMGGLGKTTIAKVVYNRIHRTFMHTSFIASIREACEINNGGLFSLQEQLISNALKTKGKITSIGMGICMITNRLAGKKALIVLDDVDEFCQLEALCGNRISMGQGSVIIITTRNRELLDRLKVDHVYELDKMNENESLELFCWHAFGKAEPIQDFNELARNAVAYCDGLPLALQVLGSYLYNRTWKQWTCVLSKLEVTPDRDVQKKLKVSFEGLSDPTVKDIFLDVCCFFIGKDKDYVEEILNGCGLHSGIGISVLLERSLIKIEKNNKLGMHNLLKEMGREIIREVSRKKPEKQSRLWFRDDVVEVLTKNIGTKSVEGLSLKLPRINRVSFKAEAFEKMHRLRLLQFEMVRLAGDYSFLSENLRWVCWRGFPSKYIPKNFNLGCVVAIDIRRSNLRLVWKEPQDLGWLKFLNLSHSMYLTETPEFSKLPNLEKLILKDCPRLCKVHKSIGDLRNLILLNLKDCKSLGNFPRRAYKLKSLKTLILSGCSKINKLEEDIMQMESLTTLIAENTAVQQMPFSIVSLKCIKYIFICEYEGLSCNVFPSVIRSWMSPIMNPLSYIRPFGCISPSLVLLGNPINASGDALGDLAQLLAILQSVLVHRETKIQHSKQASTINELSCTDLEKESSTSHISKHSLSSCIFGIGSYQEVFETLSKSIYEGLEISNSCDDFLPGDNYPYWLAHKSEGHSVCFVMPEGCRMKGMTLCIVYSSTLENMANECLTCIKIDNRTQKRTCIYKSDTISCFNDEDWQEMISYLECGDTVEIVVTVGHGFEVKKTALYLMCGESIDMEMKLSAEPKKEPKINAIVRIVSKNIIVAFGLFVVLSIRSLTAKRSTPSHS